MKYLLVLALLGMLLPFQQPTERKSDTKYSAAEALQQVGKANICVRLKVERAKDRLQKRGIIYLDSEEDFNSPNNLGIALSASVAEELKEQGIQDTAEHFQGKMIEVTGCVMRFEERVYLPVLRADQIKCLEDSP